MLLDAARFEDEYAMEGLEPNTDDEVESMREMLEWAVSMVDEQRKEAVFLVAYFETALNEVSPTPILFLPLFCSSLPQILGETKGGRESGKQQGDKTQY